MHASSLANMHCCLSTYADDEFFAVRESVSVLELGSADHNGSCRSLLRAPKLIYIGVDRKPGPGVDITLSDPYQLPFETASMDLVVSGQMLEHCEFFWLMFREMVRVLKPDGYLFLIAPSSGPMHRYPVDCYRFYPDGFRALAKDAQCQVVDLWLDEKGPWKDLTGIFSHRPVEPRPRLYGRLLAQEIDAAKAPSVPACAELERTFAGIGYREILKTLHEVLEPKLYLEIGIREGVSLALARGPAIGVDPNPLVSEDPRAGVRVFRETSDSFFAGKSVEALKAGVDLAFIDGMHWAEFALRDFMHIEQYSNPWSVIVFDDIFPIHPVQAARRRETCVWTGDVWRTIECLRKYRPDLLLLPLATAPTGLMLVFGLNPKNRLLFDRYNPIVAELRRGQDTEPPIAVLERQGALHPEDPRLRQLLASFARLAEDRALLPRVRSVLADWRAQADL